MRKSSLISLCATLIIVVFSALSWIPTKQVKGFNTSSTTKINNLPVETDEKTSSLTAIEVYYNNLNDIYTEADLKKSGLNFDVFKKAVTGYYNLKQSNTLTPKKDIVSIVDFNMSSREKRFWVIDLSNKKLLFNSLVAHGRGSGDDMARQFSNTANSHQSSLGFYVTGATYHGKHGLSLKLNGIDKGHNTNALSRAVVVHGAEYVSQEFVNRHGRLGRSHGCPALPVELTRSVIDTIKDQTCLFINGPETTYSSSYLNEEIAASYFSANSVSALSSL